MKHSKRMLLLSVLGAVFLCAVLIIPSLGKSPGQTEDERFAAFTRELFLQEISSNTMTLHYTLAAPSAYGVKDAPVTFGLYSAKSKAGAAAALENMLETLSGFSRPDLSEGSRLTYDILEDQLPRELALSAFPYYEEVFSPSLGAQAQLPVLLAEYAFYSEADIQNYLSLLSQLDTYYDSLLEYERERARAGFFMSDETADAVITQCRDFIAGPKDHFLLSTFEDRLDALDFLTEEEKNAYTASNRTAVFGHVLPAYETLIQELTKLKGTGTNPYGLCYYDRGADYYAALAACTTGSGRSMDEIISLLDEQLSQSLHAMADLLKAHPDLPAAASQTMEILDPLYILETLEEKIKEDFPAAGTVSCQVKYVDPSLEDYLSPAFYLTPPMDRMEEHVIYINPAGGYDGLSLFTTLAHEGYPGHLYQTVCENSVNPDPVRRLFYFGGYVEGWATYVEWLSYSYTPLDPDMAALLSANASVSLGLHARADAGIHYEGWTPEDTARFFARYGIKDAEAVHSIYQAVLQDPGNYLKYYLGAIEILDLRRQAEEALGARFSAKEFHTFLLSAGPAPFPVLERYMREWIAAHEKSTDPAA